MTGFGNMALAAPAVILFLAGLWIVERAVRQREQVLAARATVPAHRPVAATPEPVALRSVPLLAATPLMSTPVRVDRAAAMAGATAHTSAA